MLTVLFVQNQMVLQATTVGAVILEVGFYFNFWAFSIARADSQLFHDANPMVPDLAIPACCDGSQHMAARRVEIAIRAAEHSGRGAMVKSKNHGRWTLVAASFQPFI